jgi:hypothetical protein
MNVYLHLRTCAVISCALRTEQSWSCSKATSSDTADWRYWLPWSTRTLLHSHGDTGAHLVSIAVAFTATAVSAATNAAATGIAYADGLW